MKDSRINWLWSLKNRGILPTWNWIQNETSYWNPPPLYSPLSLLSFALFLSPPLLSNLLSSLTDTYTCNSQPDPSESKLRFELPASGQISRRNPEWRHVFAPLPIFPRFSSSSCCLYIRIRVVSSSPLSQSSSSKSNARGLNVLWERGGHVFNPRWKQVKWLKSRWILHLIQIIT